MGKLITDGKNFKLYRLQTNKYRIDTGVSNPNIYMEHLLNFKLIELFYNTNINQFEKIHMEQIHENKARVFLLVKHLFASMGVKQRYISFDIYRYPSVGSCIFHLVANPDFGHQHNDCSNASLLPIKEIYYTFTLETQHSMSVTQFLFFEEEAHIPAFLESIFGLVVKQMTKNTMKFISSIAPPARAPPLPDPGKH